MALGNPEGSLPKIAVTDPTIMLVSAGTGGTVQRAAELTDDYWRRLAQDGDGFAKGAFTLVEAGVDIVVALGADPRPEWTQGIESLGDAKTGTAPKTLDCLLRPGDETEQAEERFLNQLARVYEAGTAVSFEGLFAGEERSRIAIPGYPFQRRSFWVQQRRSGNA